MGTVQFRANPRPNVEVIDLLEKIIDAAKKGLVCAVVVVPVNPVNEVEAIFAGDLSRIRSTALIGGLVRAAHDLTRES